MQRGILGISILIMIGTFFSKILGFVREIIFAHQFGADAVSDAFFLTRSIPNVFFSALAIAISTNFIPTYMAIQGEEQKKQFTSNLLNICVLLSVLVCGVINIFPEGVLFILVPTLSEEVKAYSIPMLRVIAISIIPMIGGRIFQSYSQSNNQFVSTAILGIVTNLIIIISYLLASQEDYIVLSIGVVCAQAVSMVMFLYGSVSSGFSYNLIFRFNDSALKEMLILTIPLMIGRFAEDASILVDRNLAAGFGTGIISVLSYSHLLGNSVSSMITNSITTATFPTISRLIAEMKFKDFRNVFLKYLNVLIYLFAPISVYMIIFADDLVILILQHGVLQPEMAKMIAWCMAIYAAGILPLGLQNYFVRGFYAFHNTQKPTIIIVLSLIINIALSIVGAHAYGYLGIVVATTISYFIACVLLMLVFQRKYRFLEAKQVYRSLYESLASSLAVAIIASLLLHIIEVFDSIFLKVLFESIIFWGCYIAIILFTHKSMLKEIKALL